MIDSKEITVDPTDALLLQIDNDESLETNLQKIAVTLKLENEPSEADNLAKIKTELETTSKD